MVWGIEQPKSLGEFFPDGNLEGGRWPGRMMGHFHRQPADVQKALFDVPMDPLDAMQAYEGFVVDKFRCEAGSRTSPRPEHPPLTPILDHELPSSFDTEKTYNSLGSLIGLGDRITAVDAEFKGLVERLEPGTHEFYPIEIRMPKGQVFPKPLHILVVGQHFDSFVPEKSIGEPYSEIPNSGGKLEVKSGPNSRVPDLAFAQSIFGSAHLWRERRFGEWLTCLSDVLVAEIRKAGLRTPKLHKMIAA